MQNFSLQVCTTKGIYEFYCSFIVFFISRRVEVDKKNQHHTRHLNNYGLQKTIFHVSPTDGVGHTRKREVWNFSDDPLFSTFTGNGKVGSNYGIQMVVKNLRSTWWLLHFPALFDSFYERKEVFFSKDVLNWLLISDLSLGIRKLCSGIIVGPKNNISRTADEWYANEEHSSR